MVAASKLAHGPPDLTGRLAGRAPEEIKSVLSYLRWFRLFSDTREVNEKLVQLGAGSRDEHGKFKLRDDLREILGQLLNKIERMRNGGAKAPKIIMALFKDAERNGVTMDSTFGLYGIIYKRGKIVTTWAEDAYPAELLEAAYIGETKNKIRERWSQHPNGCPLLAAAIANSGGDKNDWACLPILALPESDRSKELLLYFESEVQRALGTVGGYGLNIHHGAGRWGGAKNEAKFAKKFVKLVVWYMDHGTHPRVNSKDDDEKKLGEAVSNFRQRYKAGKLDSHHVRALELIPLWQWNVNDSHVDTTGKIEAILKDPRTAASGGLRRPGDKKLVQSWDNLRAALNGTGNCVVTVAHRARIQAELPGLLLDQCLDKFEKIVIEMSARCRNETGALVVKCTEHERLYNWLTNLRRGITMFTAVHEEIVARHGDDVLTFVKTGMLPADQRATNYRRHHEQDKAREAERKRQREADKAADVESKKSKMRAGPVV